MPKKLTLDMKVNACPHCIHCDKRALRQRRPHCTSVFKPHNGHCGNFVDKKKEVPNGQ